MSDTMHLQNIFPHRRNTNVTCLGTIYRIGDAGFICDADGKPFDVPLEHADRLLQGKAWRELDWDPTDPKYASRFASHNAAKGAGLGRPPRSRETMEADYGAEMSKAEGELVKGQVNPAAAELDAAGRKALRVTPDKGPITDQRLERMAKADQKQVSDSLERSQRAKPGDKIDQAEVDTQLAAAQASLGSGSEVGDGRKPGPAAEAQPVSGQTFAGKNGTLYTVPADGDWAEPSANMPTDYLRQMAVAYDVDHTKKTARKTLINKIDKKMFPEIVE